ncbi:hypothetical protein DERP_012916 [Dermatophagoides pteronyssinus]|uniref:Uncharacterized protein n=1 Tax=Dermatophagoides pteronyssinus TaxID=6956 RepID=A0ABQ8J3P3_DERPT|nr:hypothetical protein DERP_012916 [Dermatophagoides pteronyssinus]
MNYVSILLVCVCGKRTGENLDDFVDLDLVLDLDLDLDLKKSDDASHGIASDSSLHANFD